MKLFLLISTVLVTTASYATTGAIDGQDPIGGHASCSGELIDGTKVSFEVRATAAPTIVDSVLLTNSNELIAHLFCEKGSPIVQGAPSAGNIDWECGQTAFDQSMDGGILVTVMSGGVTGVTSAKVSAKQMFPLPPQHLGTLICQ